MCSAEGGSVACLPFRDGRSTVVAWSDCAEAPTLARSPFTHYLAVPSCSQSLSLALPLPTSPPHAEYTPKIPIPIPNGQYCSARLALSQSTTSLRQPSCTAPSHWSVCFYTTTPSSHPHSLGQRHVLSCWIMMLSSRSSARSKSRCLLIESAS